MPGNSSYRIWRGSWILFFLWITLSAVFGAAFIVAIISAVSK